MNNKLFVPLAIIVIGFLVAATVAYTNFSKSPDQNQAEGETISLEEAGEKLINFINDNILQGQSTASLIETLEKDGLYEVKFEVEGEEVNWYITKNGNFIFPQAINLKDFESLPKPAEEAGKTSGNFSVSNDEICLEDGKPIVYFFGSKSCPHCVWEHPIVEEVALRFEGYISFHNNMDTDADMDVFSKYSTGAIPTIVLGCKYYRMGSGENAGADQERADLTKLICDLTNNQPSEVCN
jgi:thiol-disulfide isomerase/thioredoxin